MAANSIPSPRLNTPPTPAQVHAARRAATLSRDYGAIPSPGGQIFAAEQAADHRAARDAEKMAAALAEYARLMRLAAKYPAAGRGFRADARAALHMHAGLAALIGGER